MAILVYIALDERYISLKYFPIELWVKDLRAVFHPYAKEFGRSSIDAGKQKSRRSFVL